MKLYMKQKYFSFTDRYKVYDENENPIYHIETEFLSLRNKFTVVKDDQIIFYLKRRLFTFFTHYLDIFDQHDEKIGLITKYFSFFVPKLSIDIKDKNYVIEGQIFAHDFTIYNHGKLVATISKKWLSWGDSYEIDVDDQEDIDLIVVIVMGIDRMLHSDHSHSSQN